MSHPRVLLASDNAPMASRLRALLGSYFDVVGVVSGGKELEAGVEALAPEAVIVEIARPGQGGLVAARRILALYPGTAVVLLSVIDDCALIQVSSSAGIHGFLLGENAVDELVFALEAVLKRRDRLATTAGYHHRGRVKERRSPPRRSSRGSPWSWVSLSAL